MFEKVKEKFVPLLIAAILLGGVIIMFSQNNGEIITSTSSYIVNVKVPELSPIAKEGEVLFDNNCAACHGKNAGGSEFGPPFVNDIYNPGHHGDEAFVRAALNGVQAHHWGFGNMPPQPQVSEQQVLKIVRYVRELQQANGIVTRPHNM